MNFKSPKVIAASTLGVAFLLYVGWVVAFELRMGLGQPQSGGTLVFTTTQADGSTHDRVLARLQDDETLYVAVNHWPRAWYRQAMANPEVQVTMDGETKDYLAVRVTGEEEAYLHERFPMGFRSKLQMGFPPRYFVRLDPQD